MTRQPAHDTAVELAEVVRLRAENAARQRYNPQHDEHGDPAPEPLTWTLVERTPRGRAFYPIAGAPVGTWTQVRDAAQRVDLEGREVWYVPTHESELAGMVTEDDVGNILLERRDRTLWRAPIRWNHSARVTWPPLPPGGPAVEPDPVPGVECIRQLPVRDPQRGAPSTLGRARDRDAPTI